MPVKIYYSFKTEFRVLYGSDVLLCGQSNGLALLRGKNEIIRLRKNEGINDDCNGDYSGCCK